MSISALFGWAAGIIVLVCAVVLAGTVLVFWAADLPAIWHERRDQRAMRRVERVVGWLPPDVVRRIAERERAR